MGWQLWPSLCKLSLTHPHLRKRKKLDQQTPNQPTYYRRALPLLLQYWTWRLFLQLRNQNAGKL